MRSPCLKCKNSGTVHTRCEKYNSYRSALNKQNKVRNAEMQNEIYHAQSILHRADMMREVR